MSGFSEKKMLLGLFVDEEEEAVLDSLLVEMLFRLFDIDILSDTEDVRVRGV
jgi:hypothetical protein